MSYLSREEGWAAEAALRRPRGRWAGWRLFAAASGHRLRVARALHAPGALLTALERDVREAREAVATIARTPEHRLHRRARPRIAAWWARTRVDLLKTAVVDGGAVARRGIARLQTLALLDRLAGNWGESDARHAARLLTDPDPDVRAATDAACRAATGAMNDALWRSGPGRGTRLWWILLRKDEPPPARTVDALWSAWFADHVDPLGEALFRWGVPAGDARHVASTVAAAPPDPDVRADPRLRAALGYALLLGDAALRAAAAERFRAPLDRDFVEELCERVLVRPESAGFCVERGLAPRDPARRALFYVITAQWAQHRALDPDGGLLALAYAAASKAERARVRDAVLGDGELGLVRVVIGEGRRTNLAGVSREEARYLAERLADRREWDELWAFVQDLPIATAAELARLFGTWAPRDDTARPYFHALRDADPAAVEEGIARFAARPPMEPYASLRVKYQVADLSFAPDGPFLAAAHSYGQMSVFDARTAERVRHHRRVGPGTRVLHAGQDVLITVNGSGNANHPIRRWTYGGARLLRTVPHPVVSLVPTGGDGSFAAGTAGGELLLGDRDGGVRVVTAAELGLDEHELSGRLVAHPGSGRIAALGDRSGAHLIDPRARTATALPVPETIARAAFLGPGTLVCHLASGPVARLSLEDGWSGPPSETKPSGRAPGGLVALPRSGEAALIDGHGTLSVYGGEPPERVHVRPPAPGHGHWGGRLAVSSDGSLLAAGHGGGGIDLIDLRPREVAAALRRPAASLTARDLPVVTAVLDGAAPAPGTRAPLELLRAAVEHRSRFDIEIGDAVHPAAGEHDIGL